MNENYGLRGKLCAYKQEKTARGNAFTRSIRESWNVADADAVSRNTVTLTGFFITARKNNTVIRNKNVQKNS